MTVALAVAAAVYAWLLAGTRPFTLAADVLTALPLGAAVLVLVLQVAQHRAPLPIGDAAAPVTGTATYVAAATPSRRPWDRLAPVERPTLRQALPWIVLVLALVAWELATFFSGARSAHPTISSLYDDAARWHAAKAAVVWVWLATGWYLVRR